MYFLYKIIHVFSYLMKLMSKRIKSNNFKKGNNTYKCRLNWTHDYFPWKKLSSSKSPRFHCFYEKIVGKHWCNVKINTESFF